MYPEYAYMGDFSIYSKCGCKSYKTFPNQMEITVQNNQNS